MAAIVARTARNLRLQLLAVNLHKSRPYFTPKHLPPYFTCNFSSKPPPDSPIKVPDDFKPIYKFPRIVAVRLFCRAKLYQTAIALVSIQTTGILHHLGHIEANLFYNSIYIGLFASFMLYFISEITRRAVGIIYIDDEMKNIRVAYLNFWGQRRDEIVPVEDVIPFADVSEDPKDLFVKLCRYSTKKTLYVSVRYGLVIDKNAFEVVFGAVKVER